MTDVATKQCHYCSEQVRAEAVKCRHCGSMLEPALSRTWSRSQHGRRIAGLCAGLSEEFGVSVTILRLAFLLATLIGGPGIIIYLVLWVVMPDRAEPDHERLVEARGV